MKQEDRHLIALAKKEIGFYGVLASALNNYVIGKTDWEQAKHEFIIRGCVLFNDTEDIEENHKQIDMGATFCNFTLCWDIKYGFYITYGWVLDDWNTDLYGDDYGNFTPYYDEASRKAYYESHN